MVEINSSRIVKDVTVKLRQILSSGITDPSAAKRDADSRFVMTSFPERPTEYPFMTVRCNLGPGDRLGISSEGIYIPVNVFVDVFAKNVRDKDELAGSVFNVLRVSQYGVDATTGSGTVVADLYDFTFVGMTDMDEPGKEGIHRKIVECQYKWVTI